VSNPMTIDPAAHPATGTDPRAGRSIAAPGTVDQHVAEPTPLDRLAAGPGRRPRRRAGWRTWRARLVVLLMIALALGGGYRLAQSRGIAVAQYPLPTVTLTAQAIPVEPTRAGQVSEVDVHAQQHVVAGQRMGTISVTETAASGGTTQRTIELTAPSAGIVTADPAPVGSVVQPGTPFADLYDPGQLTLDAPVRVEDLPQLSPGMVATLHADGLAHPVRAVVQRVVPQMGTVSSPTASGTTDRLELVLVPKNPADVANLVPGMHFTGSVDTTRPGGSSVLHVGS